MPVRSDLAPADWPLPWSLAWSHAAYGSGGFYSQGAGALDGPGAHFRTSVHVGPLFHRAMARLVTEVDARLGHPEHLDVVDVGAGRGELLVGLRAAAPDHLRERLALTAVEVRPRPDDLDARIAWVQGTAPDAIPTGVRGLILAHEWLDDVPLDIVRVDRHGDVRLVLVDEVGVESSGPRLGDDEGWAAHGLDAASARDWLRAWWPVAAPGDRAEIGRARDVHWDVTVGRLAAGTALAIDYGHQRDARLARRYADGTLTAYRDGRVVAHLPDGSANLTAHVALDSVAALTRASVTTQRAALSALGVTSALPARELASTEPFAYAEALAHASDAAELLDPAGLGGWHWIRVDVPG